MTLQTAGSKQKLSGSYGIYLFLLLCIYLLGFEPLVMKLRIPAASVLRNMLPIIAVLWFLHNWQEEVSFSRLLREPYFLCGLIFAVCGLIGWFPHHYQTFLVTVETMYEHLRFWLCLYFFTQLGRRFPLETYGRRLFVHVGAISAVLSVLCVLDIRYHIWGRQLFRYGTSSIQLFFGHPSNLGARTVFFIGLLCLLYPYLRKAGKLTAACVLNTVLTFSLLGVTMMTLRVRLFGFCAFFVILYLYMILFRRKLHLPVVIAGGAGAFFVGRKRLYDYYFSPYAATMARGQFAINSLDIAKDNFPFGSGFGTFGSRLAQLHYSPLYYKYNMMLITGISPRFTNYACDTFFPVILAESGWLGFAAYLGLLGLVTLSVFRYQRAAVFTETASRAVFTAFIMIAFELLEATGTLAFSEIYSVMIALALGLALARMRLPADPAPADPVPEDPAPADEQPVSEVLQN